MTVKNKIIYLKEKYIKEKGTTPNTLLISEYNFKEYLKGIGHQYSDYTLTGCMVMGLFVIFSEQFSIAITKTKDIIYIDETELTKENIIQELEKANEEIGNAERFLERPCHCEQSAEISNENELQTNSFHFSWSEHADNYIIEYEIGELVYIKHDIKQEPCTITGVLLREQGRIIYEVRYGIDLTYINGYELTKVKTVF